MKILSRKDFISKPGKCVTGTLCTPLILTLAQSCIDNPVASSSSYLATCPCHGAQYDESGAVVTGPAEEPLTKYDVTFNSNHIFIADSDEHVDFMDHPSLENVGGVSSLNGIDIDSNGVLLFRKSEAEIVALSRECTHQGCGIDPFEEV